MIAKETSIKKTSIRMPINAGVIGQPTIDFRRVGINFNEMVLETQITSAA